MRKLILPVLLLFVFGLTYPARTSAAPPRTGVPEYDQAIKRGLAYMQSIAPNKFPSTGHGSLLGYAMLKAGASPNAPHVQTAIKNVRRRMSSGQYRGPGGYEDLYTAAIDLILLHAAGGPQYLTEIQAIADYMMSKQMGHGGWDYGSQDDVTGDTSIVQYVALALWDASIDGVDVPKPVWDNMVGWQIRTQQQDGGFTYHPGNVRRSEPSSLNMTANAVATLAIARDQLYPRDPNAKKGAKKQDKRFGVLEARTEPEDPEETSKTPVSNYRPKTPRGAIENALRRGIGWMTSRFTPLGDRRQRHIYYYNYASERAYALNNIEMLGPHDWYRVSGDALLKRQKDDGSWPDNPQEDVYDATSFAILFFVRATKAAVVAQFGAGLMRGGREFDLDNSEMGRDGQVKKKRKITDPLDQLLTDLSKQDPDELFAAQQAIVEKVQLGDRKELLGQIDRIRKLITNENAEIRRTAVWALGRSGDLRDAYLLINALEDTDVDVLVEAYNALSYLSRKISGVGIPANPLAELEETNPNPTQAQIDATVDRWRREALKRWSAWYFRVRPYEERNDLFELRFGAAIGNTRGSGNNNR